MINTILEFSPKKEFNARKLPTISYLIFLIHTVNLEICVSSSCEEIQNCVICVTVKSNDNVSQGKHRQGEKQKA